MTWALSCSICLKTMIRHILVVCVGNICRSPMAEALIRSALTDQGDFTVESAGLGALVGHPADACALELMEEMGEDVSAHRARQIHPDMVSEADLVLVMEAGHKRAIDTADPTARGKVHRLGEWQDRDIDDPYRQPKAAFADALEEIQEGVASWVQKIKA
jgi:protein-tyrosine phosphatase